MSSGVEWSNPHVYSTWQRSEIIELADFSQGFWTKTKREPAQRERPSVRSNSRNTQAPWKNVDKRCASSPTKSRATGSRTARHRDREQRVDRSRSSPRAGKFHRWPNRSDHHETSKTGKSEFATCISKLQNDAAETIRSLLGYDSPNLELHLPHGVTTLFSLRLRDARCPPIVTGGECPAGDHLKLPTRSTEVLVFRDPAETIVAILPITL